MTVMLLCFVEIMTFLYSVKAVTVQLNYFKALIQHVFHIAVHLASY